jgi:hypothetical protein
MRYECSLEPFRQPTRSKVHEVHGLGKQGGHRGFDAAEIDRNMVLLRAGQKSL